MMYTIKEKFHNRDLSWLSFNERVLEEAEDEKNPLLERIKFISIFSSNLDEFYMIRFAGIWDQIELGYNEKSISGLTPQEQIKLISAYVHKLTRRLYNEWGKICNKLTEFSIEFTPIEKIDISLFEQLKIIFEKEIFPILTPMAIDPTHPFPFIHSNTLNIICNVINEDNSEYYAIVPVPGILPRFYLLQHNKKKYFFLIEDIINHFINTLFHGYKIISSHFFRIIRNADLTLNEESSYDLLKEIEGSLKMRKRGAVIRLEINKDFDKKLFEIVKQEFEISNDMIYKVNGPLDLSFNFNFFLKLSTLIQGNIFNNFNPLYIQIDDIFSELKKKDIILHHPYESFQTVIDFLQQAADDNNVLAIKQTLYRSSGENSLIVKQLLRAVENGKQVTVILELKARFDEEKNINWAKKLEDAGVHVIYGVKGLKTHAKVTLVIRRENNGNIRRYIHFGTGNYNEKTAVLYTDISLLTSDEDLAYDTSAFFNYLTGYSVEPSWRKISISPNGIREKLLNLIDNEIKKHSSTTPGKIICKMNSIVHPEIIEKLYEASKAGVKIDLIVRGICCLKPGIKDLSENIHVISIVGRFLEHSRIFYFKNAGDELVFISSSDWMIRNLDRRIEIMVPIENREIKEKLINILKYNLMDNQKARILIDTEYYRVQEPKSDKKIFNAQEEFIKDILKQNPIKRIFEKTILTTLSSDT